MNGLHSTLLGLVLAGLSLHGLAMDYGQDLPSPSGPQVLANAHGEHNHWSGIGRLTVEGGRQCIGSLIDTRSEQGETTGPAYVVTAGHCISLHNGIIVQDKPMEAKIAFNHFGDTRDARREFPTRRIIWSSIQGSDLALVELDASLQQVMDQGIEPMKLGEPVPSGSEVVVVGEPSSAGTGLRLSACTEQDLPVLKQGLWVWRNLKLNNCPGIADGASGSPVIDRASNRIVSVINTLTQDAVGAIPVRRMLGCFAQGHADLNQPACELLPGFQFQQTSLESFSQFRRIALDAEGNTLPPTWKVAFTLDTPRYRYKAVRDPLACERPEGYSGTLASSTGLIDAPIAAEAGWHYLCVVGVESADALSWPGLMANAVSLPVQVLEAGAVAAPHVTVERLENGDAKLSWHVKPPHIVRYRVKRGPPAITDCDDLKGYGGRVGPSYVFKADTLPLKVCTIAIDGLKESSTPRTDLLLPDQG
ncbi:trypsin-like peptidase domain-containing protein [Pseudomonas sp. UFMG81]|uniref:trypsin-like peptidase domain-containing protein n=1 Tax=Pseudomonas sp. UFMG81 TaxID=2745936 RepID=UPI0018905AAD|nr:trypsin-like peptidase domain-containing protein [Pseudomonas sp. UFMG81]